MISQSYPVIAKHATLALPSAPARTVVPASIELDNGESVKVAHNQDTGAVSWYDPKAKRFEFFRSLAEATTELNLNAMGLRKTSVQYCYKGNSVIVTGSVFSQAPAAVKDEYRDEKHFLKTDNSFIWYFAFANEFGLQWYSHELKDECRELFKLLVDLDETPISDYEF